MDNHNKISVIGSTGSGGRRNYSRRTVKLLGTNNFRYSFTRSPNDIMRYADEIIRENPGFFVTHSGDSGVDEILEVIMKLMQEFGPGYKLPAIFLLKGGTANNLAEILGLSDLHYSARLARDLASGKKKLEDHVKPTDILKVTYDNNKTVYTATSFNLGMISQACYGAEKGSLSVLSNYFKRNGMKKLTYSIESLKGAFNYCPITANITYDFGDEKKSFVFQKLLDMNVINGCKHAAIKEWNYKGSPCDGQLEVMCFKDMGVMKMIRIITGMMFDKAHSFLSPYKEADQYNPYGINYTENVKGLEILILDKSKNKHLFIELGGNAWPIEKPDSPIKAELIPGAVNFVYGDK
ncbi:hypothetical protein JW756_00795 [Candidatus Woesearchaeota archaeon]|nr:hypothetical protein [Candidatus Woesearchaeota archaeon]